MSKRHGEDVGRLCAMFKALSNPQRLRIFLRLASCCSGGATCEVTPEGMRRCVGDLGEDLEVSASTLSHHLKELRQAGLMKSERRGKQIDCWISEDALVELAAFFSRAKG